MTFDDLAARFKQVNQTETAEEHDFNAEESFRLRGKVLGVLIRDARLDAARTIEDCARLLNTSSQVIESWEYGDQIPSLPQLEVLAYYLEVPISHFWGNNALENDRAQTVSKQPHYIELRNRMIGTELAQAREERQLSIQQLAEACYLDVATLQAYEQGDLAIPLTHLQIIANAVNKNMNYFLESVGYVGEILQAREDYMAFMALDEDIRRFIANPSNLAFVKIAMMFREMPTEQLRKAAEGLLDITM
ncbi:MAG: helix-turn-helix transcriptional regulator [Anaerolineae bacterium]|nr:helix-turn-helix transcriptional regulator [Anaerolineae bacterium]MCA9892155.1 helix-turn-helix transcriptional regulator [Anaerolineae bacterium]